MAAAEKGFWIWLLDPTLRTLCSKLDLIDPPGLSFLKGPVTLIIIVLGCSKRSG